LVWLAEGATADPNAVRLVPQALAEQVHVCPLRARVADDETAVVVMTGAADTETGIRLVEAGADEYRRKPVEPRLFVSRVNAALRRVRH
jgi:DNA-binding response OmpR family regulator